jgi:hypothetical protein
LEWSVRPVEALEVRKCSASCWCRKTSSTVLFSMSRAMDQSGPERIPLVMAARSGQVLKPVMRMGLAVCFVVGGIGD